MYYPVVKITVRDDINVYMNNKPVMWCKHVALICTVKLFIRIDLPLVFVFCHKLCIRVCPFASKLPSSVITDITRTLQLTWI